MTARLGLGALLDRGALAACTGSIELTVTDEDATTGGLPDAGPPADAAPLPANRAYATAIDLAGFTTMDGTYYSVETDWIVDPDGETTCAAGTSGDKDAFLHAVVCAMHDAGVFNIYPTPTYNAAHRNHFHVDLTDGADFVSKPGAPAIAREVAE